MTKVWVLVGRGANLLEIPALIWTDKDVALAACIDMFGDYDKVIDDKDGNECPYWNLMKEQVVKMYAHYYSGCGGCYAAILKPVEEGTPFVGWDLD